MDTATGRLALIQMFQKGTCPILTAYENAVCTRPGLISVPFQELIPHNPQSISNTSRFHQIQANLVPRTTLAATQARDADLLRLLTRDPATHLTDHRLLQNLHSAVPYRISLTPTFYGGTNSYSSALPSSRGGSCCEPPLYFQFIYGLWLSTPVAWPVRQVPYLSPGYRSPALQWSISSQPHWKHSPAPCGPPSTGR